MSVAKNIIQVSGEAPTVYQITGEAPGPHLLVFGAIHGNEICGTFAIHRLIHEIKAGSINIISGQITLIPISNPAAFPTKRYINYNLNNIFRYHADAVTESADERVYANKLTRHIQRCDYLLDLHSFPSDGVPFAFQDFSDERTTSFVQSLGISKIITDWFLLDRELNRAEPAQYAHQHGKTSAVVECGRNDDPESANIAYEVILNALRHLGLSKGKPCIPAEFSKYKVRDLIRRPSDMCFTRQWNNFDELPAKTIIAKDNEGDAILCAPYNAAILLPYDKAEVGTEWYFLAEVEQMAAPKPKRERLLLKKGI